VGSRLLQFFTTVSPTSASFPSFGFSGCFKSHSTFRLPPFLPSFICFFFEIRFLLRRHCSSFCLCPRFYFRCTPFSDPSSLSRSSSKNPKSEQYCLPILSHSPTHLSYFPGRTETTTRVLFPHEDNYLSRLLYFRLPLRPSSASQLLLYILPSYFFLSSDSKGSTPKYSSHSLLFSSSCHPGLDHAPRSFLRLPLPLRFTSTFNRPLVELYFVSLPPCSLMTSEIRPCSGPWTCFLWKFLVPPQICAPITHPFFFISSPVLSVHYRQLSLIALLIPKSGLWSKNSLFRDRFFPLFSLACPRWILEVPPLFVIPLQLSYKL